MDKEKIKGRAENELDDMEIFRLLDDVIEHGDEALPQLAAKNSTLRVSRFLPQIFPFLCITACTGGETCCGEGQHAWNRSCAVCPTGPTRAR